jgi:hypothetical protein
LKMIPGIVDATMEVNDCQDELCLPVDGIVFEARTTLP